MNVFECQTVVFFIAIYVFIRIMRDGGMKTFAVRTKCARVDELA